VKTLMGFAVGTLLSLGGVTAVSAGGANAAAPAQVPAAGIEVIVVTAKRLATKPIDAAEPIAEFIVMGKRSGAPEIRTPPPMAIEMPRLEVAVEEPPVVRL
jgi:hypothetical protein